MTAMRITPTSNDVFEATSDTFPTGAEAQAFADQFPKATGVGVYRNANGTFYVRFRASFAPNRANGGTNETGAKRVASFKRACTKLGITLV